MKVTAKSCKEARDGVPDLQGEDQRLGPRLPDQLRDGFEVKYENGLAVEIADAIVDEEDYVFPKKPFPFHCCNKR